MSDTRLLEDLTYIAVDIVKQMKNIIKLNGAFATGNLYNSVKYKVYKDKSEKFHLDVDYVYYGLFIDMGRKPGKQPPLRDIQEWCRIKGIPQEAAFAIARKIGRFGFKGINFTKPFENDQDVVAKIMREMGKDFADDAVEQILRDVKYFDKTYRTKK
jgi:hypothetical protein